MLADEATFEPRLYRLPDDPVADRVLIPGFRSATSVRGAFGWFGAGWIRQLAPGLAHYLNREDTQPIEFTVAPLQYERELAAMTEAQTMSAEQATKRVAHLFVNDRVDRSALGRHALDCLAWMLACGRLRLRIAVPEPDSNFHPKMWLFADGDGRVLARGSGNATGMGVASGIEQMDVDVSWVEGSRQRVLQGERILNDWSRARGAGIAEVVDLPDALKRKIVRAAPSSAPTPDDYLKAAAEDGNPRWAVDAWQRLDERLRKVRGRGPAPRLEIPSWLVWKTGRYAHQKEAVDAWETHAVCSVSTAAMGEPEPERGTLAMATGAGKTLTALICAARAQDRLPAGSAFAVVVAAPSRPLLLQWKDEISKFGVTAETPTLSPSTNASLTAFLRGLDAGGTRVAVVTNNLLCSSSFQRTLESGLRGRPSFLIADEAHRLGAEGFIRQTPDFFERRLALSATPVRQYDPDGTERIFEFFGPPVYEFGLDRAIGFCLVPYDYHVHAATLDDDEMDEFTELTRKIGAAMAGADDRAASERDREALNGLLLKRRRIVETAEAKIPLLRAVLQRRGPRRLEQTLVYASAKRPEQFDRIAQVLTQLGIRWAPVTQETTARPSELESTLKAFRTGSLQVLLAKKVLDEGVDIPSIREAYIVASSTVEREWVQRRGRALRRHPGKEHAVVHDFLALPPAATVRMGDQPLKRLVRRELERALAFAGHARNGAGPHGALAWIQRILDAYWPRPNRRRDPFGGKGRLPGIAPTLERSSLRTDEHVHGAGALWE